MARRTVYPIRFANVDYVDKTANELVIEYARVQCAVHDALRILRPLRRLRNGVLTVAEFTLRNALQSAKPDTPQAMADEIGRLSCIMSEVVQNLGKLSNSRTKNLEQARFILTYGQAHKKRDIQLVLTRRQREEEDSGTDTPQE